MISVNQGALKIVKKVIDQAEELNVEVSTLKNGSVVIDMGQKVMGSWLAGKYYAEICMGGLGEVTFDTMKLDEFTIPTVCVTTSHPVLAGWVSQKHAEPIEGSGNQPILAGPAKALLNPRDESIEIAGYTDSSDVAVAPFQTSEPITEETAEWFAKACNIKPENLYMLVAPSNSLVCSIQVNARPIDNITHRLHAMGVDLADIKFAMSRSPISPLVLDELEAMGRINDSMIYGAWCHVALRGDDAMIEEILPKLPSQASDQYGKTFKQIFVEHDQDFHKIDLRIHSLAQIQLNNIVSGSTYTVGNINYEMLRKSYFDKT